MERGPADRAYPERPFAERRELEIGRCLSARSGGRDARDMHPHGGPWGREKRPPAGRRRLEMGRCLFARSGGRDARDMHPHGGPWGRGEEGLATENAQNAIDRIEA